MKNEVLDSDATLPTLDGACSWCQGNLVPLRMTTPERQALLRDGKRTYVCDGCGTYAACEAGA